MILAALDGMNDPTRDGFAAAAGPWIGALVLLALGCFTVYQLRRNRHPIAVWVVGVIFVLVVLGLFLLGVVWYFTGVFQS